MRFLTRAVLLSGLLFSPFSLADQLVNCPYSFNHISVGDSIGTVMATCGGEPKVVDSQTPDSVTSHAQLWNYAVNRPVVNGFVTIQTSLAPRMPLVFTIEHQKIAAITLNGQKMASTPMCSINGFSVSVGDSAQTLLSQCGMPLSAEDTTITTPQQSQDVTKLIYEQEGLASQTLTFVDGRLVSP